MAGLWERIKEDAVDRMPSHALYAAMTLYVEGTFSVSNLLAYLNQQVTNSLAGDEITDANAIRDVIDGLSGAGNKHVYVGIFHALNLVAESNPGGELTEAAWRAKLGIEAP